jgi:hypothetical protein
MRAERRFIVATYKKNAFTTWLQKSSFLKHGLGQPLAALIFPNTDRAIDVRIRRALVSSEHRLDYGNIGVHRTRRGHQKACDLIAAAGNDKRHVMHAWLQPATEASWPKGCPLGQPDLPLADQECRLNQLPLSVLCLRGSLPMYSFLM